MKNKIKSLIAYSVLVVISVIITSCSNSLPVSVGFQDEGFKSYYSPKGGLEVVIDKTSGK